jgi:hypothetical protein
MFGDVWGPRPALGNVWGHENELNVWRTFGHPGWAGIGVSATPYSFNGGADGWREGCLQAGAVTATRRGPRAAGGRREAVTVTAPQPVAAQDAVIFNEPGRRARVAWGDGGDPMPRVHAPAGYGMGAALQITALVWLPGSHPSCQPSAEPMLNFRGRGSSGESRQRERGLR